MVCTNICNGISRGVTWGTTPWHWSNSPTPRREEATNANAPNCANPRRLDVSRYVVIWLWFLVWYFLVKNVVGILHHTVSYFSTLSMALRVSGDEVALRQGAAGQGATSQGASHALAAQEGSWCWPGGRDGSRMGSRCFPDFWDKAVRWSWFLMFLVELGWHYFLLSVGYLRLCKQNV